MNIRKFLVFAFLCILWTQVIIAQDATAEFVTTNKEITITPEFPGFCSIEKGVTVTVNEAFENVAWYQPQELYTKAIDWSICHP